MISKPLVLTDLIINKGEDEAVSGSALYGVASLDKPLEALDASVTMSIDGASSSATIRLAPGTSVNGRCYVEMFTVLGSAGVFRTRSPQIGYGTQNTMLNLEHSVNELGDFIINDKLEEEMTLKAAAKKIFSYYSEKSSLWQLGTVETPIDEDGEELDPKCVLSIDHDNCLDALQSIMEQYPNMMFTFNFKVRPWKLHIRNRQTEVTAEGRLSRNIKSASVIRDDSEMYTRVYMDGYKNKGNQYGYAESKYYKGKYGLIETTITGANDTAAIAERTVKNYLKKHRKPRYSINIEGIALSTITGESFDKFELGKQMRLALAKYNTTVIETITSMTFPSVYKNPDSVSIVLADENDTVIRYIKKAQKTASKAASSAKAVGRAAIIDATVSNNVLTLTKGDGTQVNFSKAVTLENGWSGGRFTVKVKQTQVEDGRTVEHEVATAETKLNGIVLQANKQPSASGTWDLRIPLKVMYDNGLPASIGNKSNTEYAEDVIVSAKAVYDKGVEKGWMDGWDDASAKVVMPSAGNANSFTVKVPARVVTTGGVVDRVQVTRTFNLTADNPSASGYAYATYMGTKVARISLTSWWTAGWDNAEGMVELPAAGTDASCVLKIPNKYTTTGGVVNREQVSRTYTLSVDDNYAYLKQGGTTVARVANSQYSKSGTLYYDSYEFSGGQFVYHYHQTVSQQSQAIVQSGYKTVHYN